MLTMFLIRFFCFLKISCSVFAASDVPALMAPNSTTTSGITFPLKKQLVLSDEDYLKIVSPYKKIACNQNISLEFMGHRLEVSIDPASSGCLLLIDQIEQLAGIYKAKFFPIRPLEKIKDADQSLELTLFSVLVLMEKIKYNSYENLLEEIKTDERFMPEDLKSSDLNNALIEQCFLESQISFQKIINTVMSFWCRRGRNISYPFGSIRIFDKVGDQELFLHYIWTERGPILSPSNAANMSIISLFFYPIKNYFKGFYTANGEIVTNDVLLIEEGEFREGHPTYSCNGVLKPMPMFRLFRGYHENHKFFFFHPTQPKKLPLGNILRKSFKDCGKNLPFNEQKPIICNRRFVDFLLSILGEEPDAAIHLPTSETDIDFIYLDMMDNILSDNDQAAAKNMLDSLSITYQEILAIETSSAAQQEATPSDIMSATDILASIRENTRKRLLDSITASANPKEDALKKATFERKQAQRKKGKPAPKSKPEKKSSSVKTASPKTNQLMLEETLEELRRQKRLKFNHVTSYMNQIARETGEYSASFQNYLKQNVRVNGSHINGPGGTLVMPHGGSDATVAGVHVAEFIAGLWKTFEDNL